MDVVLVPGLWLTAATWDPVVTGLRAAGHVPNALTLPGMDGDSDPAEVTLGDHVTAVVDAIDGSSGPVLIVGHSAGAGLAWAAADARVDRVAGVVLVGGFPTGDGQPVADGLDTGGSVVPFPGWEAFDDADVRDLDAEARAQMEKQMLPSPARVLAEPQRLGDDRRLQLPVTMVCTEFSPDDAKGWIEAGAMPVSELGRMESVDWVDLGSGHWPQASCPDRLTSVILKAAERVQRG